MVVLPIVLAHFKATHHPLAVLLSADGKVPAPSDCAFANKLHLR